MMEEFQQKVTNKQIRDLGLGKELFAASSMPMDLSKPSSASIAIDDTKCDEPADINSLIPFEFSDKSAYKPKPYPNSGPKQLDGTNSMDSFKGSTLKPECCGVLNNEVGLGASGDNGCVCNNEFYAKRNAARGNNNKLNDMDYNNSYNGDLTFTKGNHITNYDPDPVAETLKKYKPIYMD